MLKHNHQMAHYPLQYSFKYNQQDAMLYSILYYCQCSTCFGRFFRPSSGAQELYTQHVYVPGLLAATISVVELELQASLAHTRCCVYSS